MWHIPPVPLLALLACGNSVVAQITTRNTPITTSSKVYKVSAREDELIQMARRGARVAQVRGDLELTGEAFAQRVVDAAKRFGVAIEFDKWKLSRIEGGTRAIAPEELVAILQLDPKGRSAAWLVFGSEARSAKLERPDIPAARPSAQRVSREKKKGA